MAESDRRVLTDAVIGRVTTRSCRSRVLTIVLIVGRSIFNIMIVIGLLTWPTVCRLVRGEFLSLRAREYTLAARASGRPTGGSSSATSCQT